MNSRSTLIGRQIDEYRLEAMLGEGGMASVYRAIDVRLNRYVAIKVIQTSMRNDSTYTMRFEREAQAIAQLQHPNIITLYRFGDQQGLLYLAMQYVEGADLSTVIDSFRDDNAYVEYAEIVRLAHEVGAALDYAHSRGVIHRDIKPHNIMINADNHAIVTDFGLALLTDLGTQGEIFGSPHYIAPEQAISSAGVVPQSDLYAFAVVLYEMLTNRLPFDAADPLDVAMMHMTEPLPSPLGFRPELPAAVEDVLYKALAKSPEDRYENGKALAEALEAALLTQKAPESFSRLKASTIAERVAIERDANPLPPIPGAAQVSAPPAPVASEPARPAKPAPTPPPAASEPEKAGHSAEVTRPHEAARTQPSPSVKSLAANPRLPIYAGVVVLGLAIMLILFAVLSGGGDDEPQADVLTEQSAAIVADNPTQTPGSLPTQTPLASGVTPAATAQTAPTAAPTNTAQPGPGATPQLSLLMNGVGLTTGRAVQNGEFEVEGYCTGLNTNFGVDEDGTNWYCTQNGQPVITLSSRNFDEICRRTYRVDGALAVQVEGSAQPAYRWRCFGPATQESSAASTGSYTLRISWQSDDSLFVTNSGTGAFPLNPLVLAGDRQINGSEWGLQSLAPGECVAVWKSTGNPVAADSTCTRVGLQLSRGGRDRFWTSGFDVLYNGLNVTACQSSPCTVQIQP